MAATVIKGKEVAASIREELAGRIETVKKQGVTPGLCVILVGEDPASISYVTGKEKACKELGMHSETIRLPESTTQEDLLALVEEKNKEEAVHGILVQLPLPKHINEELVINTILPEKDVDGFHPVSLGKMLLGQECFISCTPHGILKLLEYSNIDTSGKEIVVVGRSNIVGKPIANLLFQKRPNGNATVTICHTRTKDLAFHTKRADIIIAAAGVPEMITADMVSEGAVVIDVGVNRVEDSSRKRGFRLVGDVAFAETAEKASYITPVPGGVGPMTITMLMYNTVESAERKAAGK